MPHSPLKEELRRRCYVHLSIHLIIHSTNIYRIPRIYQALRKMSFYLALSNRLDWIINISLGYFGAVEVQFEDAAHQEAHPRVFLTNPQVQEKLTRPDAPSRTVLVKQNKGLSVRPCYLTWERECINCIFGSPFIVVCLPDLVFFIKVKVNWSVKGLHLHKCSIMISTSVLMFFTLCPILLQPNP